MALIDSPQNAQVKLLRSLATARGRDEHDLMLVEGVRSVAALIEAGWTPAVACVCPDLLPSRSGHAEDLVERLEAVSHSYLLLSERAFRALSDTLAPQGVAVAVRRPHPTLWSLPDGPAVFLALHELRDPGNMGTMVRSADAAAAGGVLAVGDCVDVYAPKVVRATAGSLFHVPVVPCGVSELVAWARSSGAAIVATDMAGEHDCREVQWPERVVLLIGSEAHGLPEGLLTAADLRVRIPMPGRAESLNAAVAAGILLYESIRQRY